MHQLIKNIEQWAEDRNLINGSTPQKQMLKLMEEFGELCGGIARNNPEMVKDAIGDCVVVIVILHKQMDCKDELYFDWEIAERYMGEKAGNPHLQAIYAAHKLGEFALGFTGLDDKPYEWKYAVNEFITELNYFAYYYGFEMRDCIQHAYNQIKDRCGEMRNGVWVKEEDLTQ